jgi:hypothetical protein
MRRTIFHLVVVVPAVVPTTVQALDISKGPTGANHERAHLYASGAGVSVGVFDTVPLGIPLPHHLDNRLLAQYDFYNRLPSQDPDPLTNPVDDHERLAADIVAGNDPLNTGVAPQAQIYLAAINDLNLQSRRAASAWLVAHHDVQLFSLSAGFGANTNGTSEESLYWDWFMHAKGTLLVASASNSGLQISTPADSFNGIAVGAYDQATGARWSHSAFALSGIDGTEVRGKPEILAPGVWIGDGISYNGTSAQGTSFAAPHVAGAAALLVDFANRQSAFDALDRRGIKALLLNSARKRNIAGPELLSPVSSDLTGAHPVYDKDFLNCASGTCTFRDVSTAGTTADWTPAEWAFSGVRFTTNKPLDDEQGTGYLDATRAIINLAGGNFGPGAVAGIGWDQGTASSTDDPAAHTYSLNQALSAGSLLTATLTWDRIALESDGDGVVDDDDTYALGELANLDLRLLNAANQIVAESISPADNVEHLHVPLPASAAPGAYKLQVVYNGGGTLLTDFALAWWTDPTPLVPGDYNLDGTVDAIDYQVWRAHFASSTAESPLIRADGNHDGHIDAADYAIWRDHVGQTWSTAAVTIAGAAVPESSTPFLTVFISAALTILIRRR